MTSIERMYALWQATRYIVNRQLEGDIIECGVWRGGSSLLVALTLTQLGDTSRGLHLLDTFEGMPPPSDRDVSFRGEAAAAILARED
ncbi:MAG: TylF/MycF/NovP-related O-methyltransferase, partial [Solirubrobacteraceae bacterium]